MLEDDMQSLSQLDDLKVEEIKVASVGKPQKKQEDKKPVRACHKIEVPRVMITKMQLIQLERERKCMTIPNPYNHEENSTECNY